MLLGRPHWLLSGLHSIVILCVRFGVWWPMSLLHVRIVLPLGRVLLLYMVRTNLTLSKSSMSPSLISSSSELFFGIVASVGRGGYLVPVTQKSPWVRFGMFASDFTCCYVYPTLLWADDLVVYWCLSTMNLQTCPLQTQKKMVTVSSKLLSPTPCEILALWYPMTWSDLLI